MRSEMYTCLKFIIAICLITSIAYCSDSETTIDEEGFLAKQTALIQPLNESSYKEAMNQIWIQYNDDFNYSSFVLDEYVNKNMSKQEAFFSAISLFVLNKESLDNILFIKPPDKYSQEHNTSISAIINLNEFLWNMAKYYETQKKAYAIDARTEFNKSVYYYSLIKGANGAQIGTANDR